MKKLLLTTLFATALSFNALAIENDPNSPWTVGVRQMMVKDKEQNDVKLPVAVFLYTTGKIRIENEQTGAIAQMVCTIKKDKAIRLTWQGMPAVNTMDTTVYVDGRVFRKSYKWDKHGDVFYRMADKSTDLTKAMKRGKEVSVRFNHNGKRYDASFDLKGFTKAYANFDKLCGF